MKILNVGLLGFGTVGSGVYKALNDNNEYIFKKLGFSIIIKKIYVRNIAKVKSKDFGFVPDYSLFTSDVNEVIANRNIDIAVEVMGGTDFAKDCILKALNNKINVVTANKELLAKFGNELKKASFENKTALRYEASVAGGIPIIETILESLACEKINLCAGIVNGTTNYILSNMSSDSTLSYEAVLKDSQQKGYAEADPTADVEGYDAARKMAILASLCFNTDVDYSKVHIEGISKITSEDISCAKKHGFTIKLLGITRILTDNKIQISVYPALIKDNHPIAGVSGAFNCIYLDSYPLGKSMYYGAGAGSLPTGSAIAADIAHIGKNLSQGIAQDMQVSFNSKEIAPIEDITSQFFIRFDTSKEDDGLKTTVKSLLEEFDLKSESMTFETLNGNKFSLAVITQPALTKNLLLFAKKAEASIKDAVLKNIYRIEDI